MRPSYPPAARRVRASVARDHAGSAPVCPRAAGARAGTGGHTQKAYGWYMLDNSANGVYNLAILANLAIARCHEDSINSLY
jgi:hypothetical protein